MLRFSSLRRFKSLPIIILSVVIGSLFTILISTVLAHGGDASKIHACIRPTLLNGGPNIRIVGANTNCNNNETPLDWNIQGIQGPPGSGGSPTLICPGCTVKAILARTETTGLSNENLDYAILNGSFLWNADLSGSSLVFANLYQLQGGFVEEGQGPANFTDADLTDASLMGANLQQANFTGANLTRANFTFTDLTGAIMTDAILTDAIWKGTNCPDGTNSDSNSNTCVGHLTP